MELKQTPSQDITQKIHQLCTKQTSSVSLQDDFGLYIPPSAKLTPHAKNTFDLSGAINDFIDSDQCVLLILGESGCGKSFFGQALIKQKSERFYPGDRISFFISLPSLRSAKTSLMEEALGLQGFTKEEIEQLRTTQKFLLIFDAYDELNCFDNLYMTNNMEKWDAKIIITCRCDYLAHDDNYKCYFMPYIGQRPVEEAIHVLFVAPFVRGQIEQYIIQYLRVKRKELRAEILIRPELSHVWLLPKTYEEWIEKLPGLKELVCQPFLLRITMEVLPIVVVELHAKSDELDKFKMTSVKLYDHFVHQWFTRQKNKLSSKLISRGDALLPTFQKDCINFAKALAKKMCEKKMDVVYYEDQSTKFVDEEESINNVSKEMNQWAVFFSDEMIAQDKGAEERRQHRIRIRKASMLKKVGISQWAFMHASLRDYFMTLNIVSAKPSEKGQLQEPISPRPESAMGRFHLFNRPSPRAEGVGHRLVGSFYLMNRMNKQEAEELQRNEGMPVIFDPGVDRQKVILGRGSFGKLRIAQHLFSHRFAGVKKIRGEKSIKASAKEAEFQRELNGLSNVMPIWDSQTIISKKTREEVLLHFMPLAGFGNGEKLVELLKYIDNPDLKRQFLIHILKSLLIGFKGLHRRKVYHLDFKPANFVIDCQCEIYIIDFGCAYREYGNKNNVFLCGGKGDYDYFSPERMANKRKHPYRQIASSDNLEPGEFFDGEKVDTWAVGISLLKMYLENMNFITGSDKSAHWVVENLTEAYVSKCFEDIPGWADAPEDSLLGCIKTLLRIDPAQRLTASEALKNPLFFDARNELSPDKLQQLMLQLIQWKTEPPLQVGVHEQSSDEIISL